MRAHFGAALHFLIWSHWLSWSLSQSGRCELALAAGGNCLSGFFASCALRQRISSMSIASGPRRSSMFSLSGRLANQRSHGSEVALIALSHLVKPEPSWNPRDNLTATPPIDAARYKHLRPALADKDWLARLRVTAAGHGFLRHGRTSKDLRQDERGRCGIDAEAHGDVLNLLREPLHNLRAHLGHPATIADIRFMIYRGTATFTAALAPATVP